METKDKIEHQLKKIYIRFNTKYTGKHDRWRVVIDGEERNCGHVIIKVPSRTAELFVKGEGLKHNIFCEAKNVSFYPANNSTILIT